MFETPSFLDQAKSHTALRRELEEILSVIESRFDADASPDADHTTELTALPNRFIARQGDRAVTFSWIAGNGNGVSDGQLMVIEWSGVSTIQRGLSALRTATQIGEAVYHAEGESAESWLWRDSGTNGGASSTGDLVAAWLDRVVAKARPIPVPAV